MLGILCEKPSAARNFASALGGMSGTYNGTPYVIAAARGHLFEFAEPEDQVPKAMAPDYKSWDLKYLPWDESRFKWKRVKKSDVQSTLDAIKQQLGKCDEICIATDVDPTGEGELLAWEILDELNLAPRKWSRMYFMDEAPKSIQNAFVSRKQLKSMDTDMDYVKADYRSKFDFLTMQFTRIATKHGDGHSVLRQGRLKSAMVLIVGDQLKAISEYKKVPFYENRFRDENGVVYTDPEEPKFPKKEDVPKKYSSSPVKVDSKTMKSTPPPKMLDLASLSARLTPKGFKAQQVLDVYQKMYEAQIVSYPRTEDKVITPEQFNELLPLVDKIAAVVGVDKKLLTHRTPRSTHVKTGGAHGANRPGPKVPASLDALSVYDNGKGLAAAIYSLLAHNYLATLAEDYEYELQKGHVAKYPTFVGSVQVPKKPGWRLVYDADDDDDSNAKGLGTQAEPFVHEGFPPKPQQPTMKWLMKQLEKRDVGTGATRTSIYADVTNEKSKYPLLIEKKGVISMAPCGDMSYGLLPNTNIGDLTMTEQLQKDMREIAAGKLDPEQALKKIRTMVREDIDTMAANGVKMRADLRVNSAEYAEGVWQGRQIRFKRVWAGYRFSDKEVADLLAGKEISVFGLDSSDGTKYNVKGRLEEDTYQNRKYVGFKKTAYIDDSGNDKIQSSSSAVSSDYCTGTWKKQNVRFKRKWGTHTFTDDECEKLLAGKTISFDAVNQYGKTYTAKGKLGKNTYNGVQYIGFKPDFD